jgi:Hg(II)-responsive transcriptional regulator
MQIGELAKQAGVTTQTIRFYERCGVLKKPERMPSGYRSYSLQTVQTVRFIKQAQELGYTLEEIKQLLFLHEKGGNAEQVRALATAKIESINKRIESLAEMRDQLESFVSNCHCGDKTQPDCPAIAGLDFKTTT